MSRTSGKTDGSFRSGSRGKPIPGKNLWGGGGGPVKVTHKKEFDMNFGGADSVGNSEVTTNVEFSDETIVFADLKKENGGFEIPGRDCGEEGHGGVFIDPVMPQAGPLLENKQDSKFPILAKKLQGIFGERFNRKPISSFSLMEKMKNFSKESQWNKLRPAEDPADHVSLEIELNLLKELEAKCLRCKKSYESTKHLEYNRKNIPKKQQSFALKNIRHQIIKKRYLVNLIDDDPEQFFELA
jgi:hypothetical protein